MLRPRGRLAACIVHCLDLLGAAEAQASPRPRAGPPRGRITCICRRPRSGRTLLACLPACRGACLPAWLCLVPGPLAACVPCLGAVCEGRGYRWTGDERSRTSVRERTQVHPPWPQSLLACAGLPCLLRAWPAPCLLGLLGACALPACRPPARTRRRLSGACARPHLGRWAPQARQGHRPATKSRGSDLGTQAGS